MISSLVLTLAHALAVAPQPLTAEWQLHPVHRFHGVGQSIPLEANVPQGIGVVDLVLMDEAGVILASPRSSPPGRLDLASVMPAAVEVVQERRQACYLQMVVDDIPRGSSLVIEPLLSRLVPRTELATHPVTAQAYSRIIGFDPEPDGPPTDDAPPPTTEDLETLPRVFSGIGTYIEQDVLLETTLGNLRIALAPHEAPNTAWNFRHLADGGFYRGVIFHRVIPLTATGDPFVVQAGDPSGTGAGGPGYWLPMEPSDLPHDFGVISMARADHPDSAGSQFFICLSRAGTARLDGQYCGFGYAVDGAETILAISQVELADVAAGWPVDPPRIERSTLVPAPPRQPGEGRPDGRVKVPEVTKPVRPERIPR